MAWWEHKTDLASLKEVNGIYSVYFLHAVHIYPYPYTAHIMFHFASVFEENVYHTLSYRTPLEGDIFSEP